MDANFKVVQTYAFIEPIENFQCGINTDVQKEDLPAGAIED